MMSCLYTIRNDDFVIAGCAEGAQPAFLWLLLEGERGKVGVLSRNQQFIGSCDLTVLKMRQTAK